MNRKLGRKKVAALIGIPASLILTRAAWAQTTYQWTGSGLDQMWSTAANWTAISGAGTTFPVSGDSVLFNAVSADGSNIVNFGGAAQGVTNLSFTNGAASYTVGILNSGDLLNVDAGGTLYASSNLANTQTINANIASAGAMTITSGDTGNFAIGGNISLGGPLTISGASNTTNITISGVISGSGSMTLASTSGFNTNSVGLNQLNLTGHNTYSGGTLLSAPNTILPITYTPTDQTYGVFGTGTINFNNSANQRLVPTGGNQIIYNALAPVGSGFSMQAPGPNNTFSLTMAGPITFGTAGRYLANGVLATSATDFGGNFILGLPGSPSVITLPTASATLTHFVGIAGPLIINDVVQNGGAFVGNIQLNDQAQDTNAVVMNGASTFSGSAILGGNTTGMGLVGLGTSTVGSPGAVTSGPLGTGTIFMNNTVALSIAAIGADQTVGNAIRMTSGFIVSSAAASVDPTGAHSLTLSGPITLGTNGRFITNNLPAGKTLTLGLATNPSTITLGNPTVNANLSIQTQGAAGVGGGTTIINDVLQNGGGAQVVGLLNLQLGGTIYLNAVNTFSGGIEFMGTSGATLVVGSDANMGSATGSITFVGAGTLLDTGTFNSSRTIVLNSGNTGVIDVASGQTLTLTGGITGSGDLTKGTNAGTLQLTLPAGGTLAGNVNVNGGALVLGANSSFTSTPNGPVVSGGGLTSAVSIGGALTINNGAKVAVNPSIPGAGVTNSVGSLSIGNSGVLDIGNHTTIVQNAPDETVIGKYLSTGYAGGFWNGTSPSSGAINSVVAFNDNSGATSIGYGNSSDFTFGGSTSPYAVGGPKALSGNQVVVAPALAGDLLLSGTVGPNELALMLGSFGTTGNDWAFGNIDYDAAGLVGPNDLSLLLSNFGHSSAGFVGAKTSAKSLTSTAKPSLTASASDVAPPPADGIELIVNFQSGDVEIEGNNATLGTSIVLTSAANGLVGGTTFTPAFSALFNTSASNTNGLIDQFNTFTNGSAVNGLVDLGNVYNTIQNSGDIQFQFSEKGINRGGLQTGSVTYVGVPEPTTLSLLAVASAGLLGRRRKRRNEE